MDGAQCIDLLKLGLDDSPNTEDIRNAQTKKLERIMTAEEFLDVEDFVRKYFAALYEYVKKEIVSKERAIRNFNDLSEANIETMISVPVVWTQAMHRKTERLALEAGIPNISLISEPEAVAAYISYHEQEHGGLSLQVRNADIIPLVTTNTDSTSLTHPL